jgi:putative membrane protein
MSQTNPWTRSSATAAADLAIGIAAGTVAAGAMNLFQDLWSKYVSPPPPGETAAAKAADAISEEVSDAPVKPSARKTADGVVHYLTGAALGGFYGVLGGKLPVLFLGRGSVFGALVWLICDEITVPRLRLGPRSKSAAEHWSALASHIVFGMSLDWVRRRVNAAVSK